MIGSLIFNIIALFFAIKSSLEKNQNGLRISFLFIFLFLALRFDYGNDYMNYYDFFNLISYETLFSFDNYLIKSNYFVKGNEFGWPILNFIFKPLGFISMQIFIAGFQCFIVYRFIKKYVLPKFYWMAVYLYIFEPYHLIVQSSAMRQSIVITLFLLCIDYLIEKKPVNYILTLIFGSFFHTSAIFLLPLVFLTYMKFKPKIGYIILITIISTIMIYYSDAIFLFSAEFISLYFNELYENHLTFDISNVKFGLGFLLNCIIYLMFYLSLKNANENWKIIIFNIIVASFLLIPLSASIPLISRINLYFTPVIIIAFPLALETMNFFQRRLFILLILISNFYEYFNFFISPVWVDDFYNYKTIFSSF